MKCNKCGYKGPANPQGDCPDCNGLSNVLKLDTDREPSESFRRLMKKNPDRLEEILRMNTWERVEELVYRSQSSLDSFAGDKP